MMSLSNLLLPLYDIYYGGKNSGTSCIGYPSRHMATIASLHCSILDQAALQIM